jgi:ABC-type glycerol-3-phosphate transport system substrate-binding protein
MLNLILLKYSRLNLAFMAVMFIALTTLLSACGGGTSGSSSANSATPSTTTPSAVVANGAYDPRVQIKVNNILM